MLRLTLILLTVFLALTGCAELQGPAGHEYPAEWEPHEAIWIGFRTDEEKGTRDSVTIPMLRALTRTVDVNVVVESTDLIPDGIEFLADEGVDTSRINVFIQSPTDFWFRDPGPVFLRRADGGLAIADFLYSDYQNVMPENFSEEAKTYEKVDKEVARRLGIPTVQSRVVMEGGSIEVNGRGTLILSQLTRRRNPHLSQQEIEDDLKRTLGQSHIIWLREGLAEDPHNVGRIVDDYYGFGTGGHTDEFVRFIDERTVLLAWVDEAEKSKNPISAINFTRMTENFEILSRSTDQDGNPLRIIRVPLPDIFVEEFSPSADNIDYFLGANPELQVGDTIRVVAATSYLNYVISNGIVLLPKYWKPGRDESIRQRDEVVLQLFQSAFPDREIVQIDTLFLNRAGGGMHCLVQQQPIALN